MTYSDIEVKYIDGYGSDLLVANSARVSFSKQSDYLSRSDPPFDNEKESAHKLADKYIDYMKEMTNQGKQDETLRFKDFRLIHYLAGHKPPHWTPFGHGSFTIKVKAPIFVARQLVKHQVGLVWNEISRRYYDGPVELYKMDFKESSGDKRKEGVNYIETPEEVEVLGKQSIELYNKLLAAGAATEDARSVLPLNMMTEWFWSGTIAAWMRVIGLRSHADTQRQTRIVSDKIKEIVKDKVPVSYMANFQED